MMGRMSRAAKIPIIEYLRALAALGVAWFHLTNQYPIGPVRISGSFGWLGVAVFFVISGFVLPLSLWQRNAEHYGMQEAKSFAWRRIVRIEPTYLASVCLTIALWYLSWMTPGFRGQSPQWSWGQVVAHIGYLPRFFGYEWLQPVYWTLAYEFMFYATLGLTYRWVISNPLAMVLALFFAGEAASWFAFGRFDPMVPLFAMGAIVFLAGIGKIGSFMALVGVATMAIASGSLEPLTGATGFVTALVLRFGSGWRLPGRAHAAALLLGAISYSLYVTHVPVGGRVVNLGMRFTGSEWSRLALSVTAMAVVLAFAWIFWKLVETRFIAMTAKARRGTPSYQA
jgi:peptidoglycan/LPS O-acetylase OafA/YrhL